MSKYPIEALPQKSYFHNMDIDLMCQSIKPVIVHRSNLSREMTFNEVGLLRNDVIPFERVPRLSMNLLGGGFRVDDIKFRVTGPGMEEWDGLAEISIEDFAQFIKIVETDYCPIFFDATAINNHDLPYERNISQDKELRKKLIRFNLIDSKYLESVVKITGRTKILHSPNNLNYWHVELVIHPMGDVSETLENSKSNWKEELCKQVIKDILAVNATEDKVNFDTIPKSFYTCPPPPIPASHK